MSRAGHTGRYFSSATVVPGSGYASSQHNDISTVFVESSGDEADSSNKTAFREVDSVIVIDDSDDEFDGRAVLSREQDKKRSDSVVFVCEKVTSTVMTSITEPQANKESLSNGLDPAAALKRQPGLNISTASSTSASSSLSTSTSKSTLTSGKTSMSASTVTVATTKVSSTGARGCSTSAATCRSSEHGTRSHGRLLTSVADSVKRKFVHCVHAATGSLLEKRRRVNSPHKQPVVTEGTMTKEKRRRRKKTRSHAERNRKRKERKAADMKHSGEGATSAFVFGANLHHDEPTNQELQLMKQIVLVDLDNWGRLFDLDTTLPEQTFVWGFYGGHMNWSPKLHSIMYQELVSNKCFYLHPKCGSSKDAADFALCCTAGRLDGQLPKNIVFTILSGDTGFQELQRQLAMSARESHVVNPHHQQLEMVIALLKSIGDK